MSFEEALRRGRFGIPRCTRCGRIVWPCADSCDSCMGEVRVILPAGPVKGRVMEFSGAGGRHFCLVEIEGAIRVIASISSEPRIGQEVTVTDCGVIGGGAGGRGGRGRYFFHVS